MTSTTPPSRSSTFADRVRDFLDALLGERLRATPARIHRWARLVLGFALVAGALPPIFAVIFAVMGRWGMAGFQLLLVLPCIGLAVGLLRWTGRIVPTALLLLTLFYGGLTVVASQAGGFEAPTLAWICAAPVVATLLLGLRAGGVAAVVSLALLSTFFGLDGWSNAPESSLTPSEADVRRLVSLAGLTVALLAAAFIFQLVKSHALSDLTRANRQLQNEIRQHERTRQRLTQAERLEALGRLAAGIGHEINNPLTYVVGNLQFLSELLGDLEGHAPDETLAELRELLAEMREGTDRVQEVVRDVKGFSRQTQSETGVLDLRRVAETAARMADHEIRHRARLVQEFGATPPVRGQEGRLGRVVLNLLVNAAQALPFGDVDRHGIRLATRTIEEGWAEIEVTDNGPGIPEADRPYVFDPFYSTKISSSGALPTREQHHTRAVTGSGTGLGLALARETVESMGGTITMETATDRGTTFRLRLPPSAEEDEEAASAPSDGRRPPDEHAPSPAAGTRTESARPYASPDPAASERVPRVLVADDERSVRRVVERALSELRVESATTGHEAEQRCRETAYDLIVCDLIMPDCSGMDLYHRLRDRDERLDERILFLTGGGGASEEVQRFLGSVQAPVLEKPVDVDELRRVAHERIRPRRAS